METKKFKLIKNLLVPYVSTIEISEESFTNNKKTVRWKDITEFSYRIDSVNWSMNYIVALVDKHGKNYLFNCVVGVLGTKKKKRKFAEIYSLIDKAMTAYHIVPRSNEYLQQIKDGKTVTLAMCELTEKGIEIRKGMRRKEKLFLPWEDAQLFYRSGSGGYDISSAKNKKDYMYVALAGHETRYLHAVIDKMIA